MLTLGEQNGFTLLELLLATAVLLILAMAGKEMYSGYVRSNDLDAASRALASDLSLARDRAMAGGSDYNWGAHLVNQAAGPDYYEIFSTPAGYASASTTIKQTVYLPKAVDFSDPVGGATKDLLFTRLSGTSTAASAALTAMNQVKTISVTVNGLIY